MFSHGNMTPPGASGPLASNFQITSSVGGASLPFALGYAFRQGDVPSGQIATTADASSWQCTITNAWPDGSAKFAILAGRKTLTANVPATVTLTAASPSGGTALTTTDLKNTGITASIAFGASSVSWATTDWDSPARTLVSGPVMSSWTYRKPIGSDAHLVGWLEVRVFAGGAVQVMPWVENGYINVAGAQEKSGRATFTLGGSLRYDSINDANTPGGYTLDPVVNGSGVLTLCHHTRAVLVRNGTTSYWLGTDPQITPAHNRTYLTATKLVPAYHPSSINESSLSALTSNYNPGRLAYTEGGMGSTGYSPDIGLVPNTSALWLVSGDSRAYKALQMHGLSLANYGIHYRDENTNRPLLFSSHPNASMPTDTSIVVPTGPQACAYASSHHPAAAYLPYLLTGWNWYLEEMQFQVTDHYLARNQSYRKNATFYFYPSAYGYNHNEQGGLRAQGWVWRTHAMCAALTPDADSWRSQLITVLNYNATKFRTEYESGDADNVYGANVLGVGGFGWEESNITDADPDNGWSAWQDAFFTMTVGMTWDLDIITDTTAKANLLWLRDFKYKAYAGLLGRAGTTSEYCYTRAANYQKVKVGQDVGASFSWRTTWGDVWTATWGSSNTNSSQDSNALIGGNYPDASSYWGNIQGAIAYAVDHGAPGAQAGYLRMTGATNWSTIVSGSSSPPAFSQVPVYGIKPRNPTVPYALPAVGAAKAIETISGGDSGFQSVRPSNFSASQFAYSLFNSFGSGVVVRDYSTTGAYVIASTGGHNHPDVVDAVGFDFATGAWFRLANANGAPNLPDAYDEGTNATGTPWYEANGTQVPAPPHPYSCLVEIPAAYGGGSKGSVAYGVRGAVTSGASFAPTSHRFDLASRTWSRLSSASGGSLFVSTNAEVRCVFDPVTLRLYVIPSNYHNYNSLPYVNTSTNAWASSATFSNPPDFGTDGCGTYPGAVLDPARRLILRTLQRKIRALDLNNIGAGWQLLTLSNATALPDIPLGNSELCYHQANDAFYLMPGSGGSTIYKIKPPSTSPLTNAWVCSSQTLSGDTVYAHGDSAGDTGNGGGGYKTLQYVPALQMLSWCAGGTVGTGLVFPMTLLNPT